MASASLPRRKILSAQQALDLLLDMDALDSDGGQVSFDQQLTDASLEESEMETEQEPDMPPRKMRRGTRKPCASQTAKNGTVWVEEDIGSGTPSASAHPSRFTACAGPTESAKRKITSVLQSFLCLLDKGMLLTIKECTVHQASRTEPEWKLTIHELMAFISILFVRAIMCPVGAIVDCWSENFLVPLIKETMSRDRFLSIMQHLRFDDKDTRAERVKTDRFAAISDIWTRFTKNCAESFTPGEHMTIDKQVFPTKVRCPFTQYIASKPDASKCKFGIKFLMAMDWETKYICNVSPDLGKDPSHHKGERLAENLVMSLMEPFLDDGRNVTTDSFFTSLSLSHRLLQRNTTLLGTVNKVCRELPPSAKDTAEREEFSTSVFRNGSVSLTIYTPKKKKTVCLLSSLHRDVTIGDCRKRKPNTINDYNHMKCGVDVLDQMARMYSVRAPTRRWPVAVFYNMLDLAAANAYILYKACTGWKGKRRLFLSLLAKELCCQFMQQKEMEAERKAAAAFASVVAGPIQTTQCQVQESCNRNRSRFICATCQKFTCAKCREDSHWVCKRCDNRQKDRLYVRVTLKKKATKSPKKAVKPAAAKKATKSPKKAVKPAAAKATKSPKKAVKPAAAKEATKSPKKAKAAKPCIKLTFK
nr:piggyBac transposable element-derived protein 1-like [Paramormyrops kingsleyae]